MIRKWERIYEWLEVLGWWWLRSLLLMRWCIRRTRSCCSMVMLMGEGKSEASRLLHFWRESNNSFLSIPTQVISFILAGGLLSLCRLLLRMINKSDISYGGTWPGRWNGLCRCLFMSPSTPTTTKAGNTPGTPTMTMIINDRAYLLKGEVKLLLTKAPLWSYPRMLHGLW